MIKMIRQNKNSIVGVVLLLALSASMLLFGTDPLNKQSDNYAIKVDEITISAFDFSQRRQQLEQNLQRQLGDAYYQLVDSGSINVNQQVMDRLLDQLLMTKFAAELGTTVGDSQLAESIQGQFSREGTFDHQLYAGYLASQGMTAPQFESRIRSELIASSVNTIIYDASQATEEEAAHKMKRDKTKYDALYVSVDSKDFLDKVGEIPEEEMLTYFEENAIDFETKAQVEYTYAVITPESAKDKVEVLEEDIELYYTDNLSDYQTPSKITASHIQLNFPEDSSKEAVDKRKALAQEIHYKVEAGEAIADLALEYSDDVTTKAMGGSLGTFSAGSRPAEIEKAAFALNEPGVAPLVETDYGFHIIQVDEIIPADAKPLEEVQDEIKEAIIKRDAPAYARVEAEDIYEKALGSSLEDYAKENDLELSKTDGLLQANKDPKPELAGLTKTVLNDAGQSVQIHDAGDSTVIVQVLNFQPAEIPEFEKVKDQVSTILTEKRSVELAKEYADEVLLEVSEEKSLQLVAKEKELETKEARGLTRAEPAKDVFSNFALKEALFSAHKENEVPSEVVQADGKYYIVQAVKITPPDVSESGEELDKYKREQSQYMAQLIHQSLLSVLKQESEIDIDESLLVQ